MRMPSGTEAGLNSWWMPDRDLPSGANVAVIDGGATRPRHYTLARVN